MSQSQTQKEPSQGTAVKAPTNARPRVVFTPVFSQPAFMANPHAVQAIASTRQVFTAVDTKLTAISTKLAAETKLVRNEIADTSQLQHEELTEVKRELQSRLSKLQTSIQTGMNKTNGHVEDVQRSIAQAVQSIDDRINGLEIKLTQMEGRVMASVSEYMLRPQDTVASTAHEELLDLAKSILAFVSVNQASNNSDTSRHVPTSTPDSQETLVLSGSTASTQVSQKPSVQSAKPVAPLVVAPLNKNRDLAPSTMEIDPAPAPVPAPPRKIQRRSMEGIRDESSDSEEDFVMLPPASRLESTLPYKGSRKRRILG